MMPLLFLQTRRSQGDGRKLIVHCWCGTLDIFWDDQGTSVSNPLSQDINNKTSEIVTYLWQKPDLLLRVERWVAIVWLAVSIMFCAALCWLLCHLLAVSPTRNATLSTATLHTALVTYLPLSGGSHIAISMVASKICQILPFPCQVLINFHNVSICQLVSQSISLCSNERQANMSKVAFGSGSAWF